jgi:hypothetical protein
MFVGSRRGGNIVVFQNDLLRDSGKCLQEIGGCKKIFTEDRVVFVRNIKTLKRPDKAIKYHATRRSNKQEMSTAA